jgi:hypothetical protein
VIDDHENPPGSYRSVCSGDPDGLERLRPDAGDSTEGRRGVGSPTGGGHEAGGAGERHSRGDRARSTRVHGGSSEGGTVNCSATAFGGAAHEALDRSAADCLSPPPPGRALQHLTAGYDGHRPHRPEGSGGEIGVVLSIGERTNPPGAATDLGDGAGTQENHQTLAAR